MFCCMINRTTSSQVGLDEESTEEIEVGSITDDANQQTPGCHLTPVTSDVLDVTCIQNDNQTSDHLHDLHTRDHQRD